MTTPATPGSDVPAQPIPSPAEAATQTSVQAQQAASAQQSTEIRELATTLDAPPPVSASIIKGSVTAVALTAAPPTISIQISGDTTQTIAGVRFIDSYSPVVGDTVLMVKQESDIFALGQMNDTGSGTANGWQAPTLGTNVTTNGNNNGPVQFRLKVDGGDVKVQLRGSVAIASGATALWTMPSGYYSATYRRTLLVARDSTGANTVKVDINTDGTVVLVGGTVTPSMASANDGAHSHTVNGHTHTVPTSHQQDIGQTSGTSQSHTHSYSGGTTGGQSVSHTHQLDHTHQMDDTGSSSPGTDSVNGAAHTHTLTVTAPVWVSFNDSEFFL